MVTAFRLEKGLILSSRMLMLAREIGILVNSCHMKGSPLWLIECGLSLEGVAEVDQEGPPGEGGAKAGFEETTELLK